jgi:hypothetical protein
VKTSTVQPAHVATVATDGPTPVMTGSGTPLFTNGFGVRFTVPKGAMSMPSPARSWILFWVMRLP